MNGRVIVSQGEVDDCDLTGEPLTIFQHQDMRELIAIVPLFPQAGPGSIGIGVKLDRGDLCHHQEPAVSWGWSSISGGSTGCSSACSHLAARLVGSRCRVSAATRGCTWPSMKERRLEPRRVLTRPASIGFI